MLTKAELKDYLDKQSGDTLAEIDELLAGVPRQPRLPGLMEFIPLFSPAYQSPLHLKRLVDKLELAKTQPVRLVVSVPPRHAKTETLLHYIAYRLALDPSSQIAYFTYAQRLSERKSAKAKELAMRAGVPLSRENHSKSDWRTGDEEGGLWASSVGGAATGLGYNFIIVDDPVASRADAESFTMRESTWAWFNDTCYTRLEPKGSIIICMTRWHPDDLAGRLIADGWDELTLPAITNNKPIWPERWSLEALNDIKRQLGIYGWSSLYMGNPQDKGGKVFGDLCFGVPDPSRPMLVSIGIDMAYAGKASSDYSVAVVMGVQDDNYYVLDVYRAQEQSTQFAQALKRYSTKYPGAHIRFIGAGPEKGSADLMVAMGVPVEFMSAVTDKFARAQPFAAAWNNNRVCCPPNAPWLDAFSNEIADFTGLDDAHDDQVDASAGAFSLLPSSSAIITPRYGTKEFIAAQAAEMFKQAREKSTNERNKQDRQSRFGILGRGF